jgi:hypothetical protein
MHGRQGRSGRYGRPPGARAWPLLPAAAVLALAACGDSEPAAPEERADAPARPPAGWRTVENARAGFTIAAPRRWRASDRRDATLLRTRDRLAVLTVAADRGRTGRDAEAARYALATLDALPGFEGSTSGRPRRVRGSPYETARVDARGTLRTSRQPQRISVVAYRRPGRVTYVVLAFRNARANRRRNEVELDRMLRTLRAQPPRSGRSG